MMMRWLVLACIAVAGVSAADTQTAPTEAQDSPTMKSTTVVMDNMPGIKFTGEKDKLKQPTAPQEQFYGDDENPSFVVSSGSSYRYRFSYSYGSSTRYGWRYPLPYWNAYGRSVYGDDCDFDRVVGDYYYC